MIQRSPPPHPGSAVSRKEGGGDDSGETRFGDYILLDRLGAGGSGVVYRAFQVSLDRLVALKLVDPGQSADSERFLREGRTAARLSHPHIVPIHEVGEHEGRRYLAMKLIEGRPLARTCLAPRRAAMLLRQATSAIDYAHRNGVVHRDLKPHNLMLETKDGADQTGAGDHVWVSDFGIARSMKSGSTLTATGSVMGTPAYMPPEQARGQRCDERSDVYSLGATLYELLTGRPPFEGTADLLVLMSRVLSGDPIPMRRHNPAVPADLETIVGKAMAKLPAQRYQSAAELSEDLRRFLADEPILARPPGLVRQLIKGAKRRPVLTTAVGFLCALGLGAGLHTLSLKRQLAETTVAEANALGAAGQWEAARARYADAARSFARIGVGNRAPELGLLDAYHQAPPPLLTLSGHGGAVRGLQFLPDGKQALSASADHTLRLWDLPLGREIQVLRGHTGAVTSVAVSPDGKLAVSGSEDRSLRVWDLDSGRTLRALVARGGAVLKVAISPDGEKALSRTEEGTVQLWDLKAGSELRALEVAARRLVAVAFSPDGTAALTGRNREQQVSLVNSRASLWQVDDGRELQTFGGFGGEIESVSFSPDGNRILTAGYDRTASVWDRATGRRLLALRGHLHGLTGAAFSPQDRIIVSAGRDNAVKLWDAADGKLIRSFDTGDTVDALAVSPDGNFILTGGSQNTIKLWDLTVGQEVRTFSGHESAVNAVALSPDGRLALSGGPDRRVRLWDVATGRELRSFEHGATVHQIVFSPDGLAAVAVGSLSSVKAWDVTSGQPRPVYKSDDALQTLRAVAYSPDGKLVAVGAEFGQISVWAAATGKPVRTMHVRDDVRSLVFSADGQRLLAASFDGSAHLFALDSGREVKAYEPPTHERIGAVDLSPAGGLVATGNDSKLIHVFDAGSGKLLRVLQGHLGDVRALRFSPDGETLLSTGRDRTLRVWDARTGRELHAFTPAGEAVRSLGTSRDGRFALVGSEDGSMKLWDFALPAALRAFEPRLDEARAAAQRDPGNASALRTLGEWYALRGANRWAVELLRRAEDQGAHVSPLMLGRAYFREGDFPAARRELQRARAENEAPAPYLNLLISEMGSSDQVGRLAQLNSKDGRVRFPFLGVRTRPDGGTSAPEPDGSVGATITRVFPHSPAQAAGLRAGDVITAADDRAIDSDARLAAYLASRSSGGAVRFTFTRGSGRHYTTATLTERPSQLWEPDATQIREGKSGLGLQSLTPALALSFGLDPEAQGAVITSLGTLASTGPGGPTRLQVGDVITRIGTRPIATAEQAASALAALPSEAWDAIEMVRPGPAR